VNKGTLGLQFLRTCDAVKLTLFSHDNSAGGSPSQRSNNSCYSPPYPAVVFISKSMALYVSSLLLPIYLPLEVLVPCGRLLH
jgi:hypothetical protein